MQSSCLLILLTYACLYITAVQFAF
jgi:hypothetical protein